MGVLGYSLFFLQSPIDLLDNEAAIPRNAYMRHGALTPPLSLGEDERVDEVAHEQDDRLTFDPTVSSSKAEACTQGPQTLT